ncbi:hypothetical protein WN944_005966 [Citrus x changshan-huyou]|uniref:NB-ARC domain-containing protein n=1 Tax=Citrus x changshan-huyou TaxID=2935761 RepID=A0AAP0MNF7_9ROSI
MGGIGKTTLAQLACNHDEVKRQFDKILWVCVSETFDEFRIAKAMLEALTGSTSNLDALQSLLISIDESIAGKRFLLVLDDVWDGDYIKWEPFYHCLKKGSRAGYEMSSLLVDGLPEAESKDNENISRQQLAAGIEWRPLKKFPSRCTAITIILGLRYMPLGIAILTSLRALEELHVRITRSRNDITGQGK